MIEAAVGGEHLGQNAFARVPKRRMTEIVRQGDRLGEIFVDPQDPGHRPGDLGALQGMGQAVPVMVPLMVNEYLGLVLQTTKGPGMNNPIAIPLERRPKRRLGLGMQATPRILRPGCRWSKATHLFLFAIRTVAILRGDLHWPPPASPSASRRIFRMASLDGLPICSGSDSPCSSTAER